VEYVERFDFEGQLQYINPLSASDLYIRPENVFGCSGCSALQTKSKMASMFLKKEEICYKMVYNFVFMLSQSSVS